MKIDLFRQKSKTGGRIQSPYIEVYRNFCEENKSKNPELWIDIAHEIQSISVYEYPRLTTGTLKDMQNCKIVLKLQEMDEYYDSREADIMKYLTQHSLQKNTVRLICGFECDGKNIHGGTKGNTPLMNKRFHVLMLEYVSDIDLRDYLDKNKHSLQPEIITSIIKQLCFCILELYFTFGVLHGDLSLDNILIYSSPIYKKHSYRIFDTEKVMDCKMIPVLIDFEYGVINDRLFEIMSNSQINTNNNSNTNANMTKYTLFEEGVDFVVILMKKISDRLDKKHQKTVRKFIKNLRTCRSRRTDKQKLLTLIDEFSME